MVRIDGGGWVSVARSGGGPAATGGGDGAASLDGAGAAGVKSITRRAALSSGRLDALKPPKRGPASTAIVVASSWRADWITPCDAICAGMSSPGAGMSRLSASNLILM